MISLTVRKVFEQAKRNCPYRGFIVDLVEYPDHPVNGSGFIGLRVYKDNVEKFSEMQKLSLAEWLFKVESDIRDTGFRCFIEGATNDPRKFSVATGREG